MKEDISGRVSDRKSRFRGASLLLAATFLYVAAVIGSLYTIETAYYLPAKRDLMKDLISQNDPDLMNFNKSNEITAVMKSYVINLDSLENEIQKRSESETVEESRARERNESILRKQVERQRVYCIQKLEGLIDRSPNIVKIELEGGDGETILEFERPQRLEENHDIYNSLFSRRFQFPARQAFRAENNEKLYANYNITFTTPRNIAGFYKITDVYRLVSAGFFAAFTILFYIILRFVLISLTRVLTYMDASRGIGARLIPNPRTKLERAYNLLARDASLTRLSKETRDIVSRERISHVAPLLKRVPDIIHDLFQIRGCQIWTLNRPLDNLKAWIAEGCYTLDNSWMDDEAFKEYLRGQLSRTDQDRPLKDLGGKIVSWQIKPGDSRYFFLDLIIVSQDQIRVLILHLPPGSHHPDAWQTELYQRLSMELKYAVSSVDEQRKLILQEKSKANISLSRNLGHDLTNIIATSKLELMTVRTFLSLDPSEVKDSPQKQEIFKESLEALLNNTRFLQEIVNLYRSFSYLQKPKFEEVEMEKLVEDVAYLYTLSVSKSMKISTEIKSGIPATRVEPRLLRLALFNLLTNASDSIKKSTSAEIPEGQIRVITEFDEKRRMICLTVEDSGTGICDSEGNLMDPDQLGGIFRLGFSTKANQEGEGLGLNWVQTIVREFHGGEIAAHNLPEGGAAFTIRLPVIDEKIPESARKVTSQVFMKDQQEIAQKV